MANLPYWKHYYADHRSDELIGSFDFEQYGFFMRLLNHSWPNGGIPANLDEMAKILHSSKRKIEPLWAVVGPAFSTLPNKRLGWTSQEELRSKATSLQVKNSDAAASRWCKPNALRTDMRTHSECNATAYGSGSVSGSVSEEDLNSLPTKPPLGPDTLFPVSVDEPPFDTLDETIDRVAEEMHRRHPARKCSLALLKEKLRAIAKTMPEMEQSAGVEYVNKQHEKWSRSADWNENGGEFCKDLEYWLTLKKRRWENEPRRPGWEDPDVEPDYDARNREIAEKQKRIMDEYNARLDREGVQ